MKPALMKLIKFDELTDKQRNQLKKRFQKHRRDLEKALEVVDRGLEGLAGKPKKTGGRNR
jgi:hypothetical protein